MQRSFPRLAIGSIPQATIFVVMRSHRWSACFEFGPHSMHLRLHPSVWRQADPRVRRWCGGDQRWCHGQDPRDGASEYCHSSLRSVGVRALCRRGKTLRRTRCPRCGRCDSHMNLFLQINSAGLPEDARECFDGLLQVFVCTYETYHDGVCQSNETFSNAALVRMSSRRSSRFQRIARSRALRRTTYHRMDARRSRIDRTCDRERGYRTRKTTRAATASHRPGR